jgi:nucleotide-binding universal stress UspA family protein
MTTEIAANMSDSVSRLPITDVTFARILVATDFSEQANQALKFAISTSHLFGSKLTLVHASSLVLRGTDNEPISAEILEANLDADRKEMEQLVLNDPELGRLRPHIVVAYGDPKDLIKNIALDDKADLIIAGSHGASGLERLALGSVAESLLHQESRPVLIVGPKCKVAPDPFRSILCATDLRTTGLRGARYAASFAKHAHGKLTLLHVEESRPESDGEGNKPAHEQIFQDLRQLVPADVENHCTVQLRLEQGKVAETITNVAHSECTSLIVVGLQDRLFADHLPWSTLSYLVRESPCPILGVRNSLAPEL